MAEILRLFGLTGATNSDAFLRFFQHAIAPAIALVATGAAKALASWVQNHSHARRSVELTKRISELENTISKLPKRDSSELEITPHMVLTDELRQTISELKYLQTRVHYTFHQFCSDISFRTRRAFVLYRPKGFVGYLLHTLFYASIALMLLFVGIVADSSTPVPKTGGDVAQAGGFIADTIAFMLMFGVLSIPALVLRFFALKRLDGARKGSPEPGKTPPLQSAAGAAAPRAIPSQQI